MKIPLHFREDRDLFGSKTGVLHEELGHRFVNVSPVLYSLLSGDEKPAVIESLKVSMTDGTEKFIKDLEAGS